MLGNIEELRDYHKHVMLPKMETAVDNAAIMRYISPQSNNIHPCTQTPTILEVTFSIQNIYHVLNVFLCLTLLYLIKSPSWLPYQKHFFSFCGRNQKVCLFQS